MPHKLSYATFEEIQKGYATDPELTKTPWTTWSHHNNDDGVVNTLTGGYITTPSAVLTIQLADGRIHIWKRPLGSAYYTYQEPAKAV